MTRRSIVRVAASGLVALSLLLTGGVALSSTVSGVVKNQANLGLPSVTMEWRNDATGAVLTTLTNTAGQYSISLDPATYTVKLTEPASGTVSTVPDVEVGETNTTRDFVLILSDRLPPMEIHGRVLREDTGGPAVNLRIDLLNRTTNTWYQNEIRTDENGDYSWTYWPEVGQTYGSWYFRAYTGYLTDRGTLQAGWILVRDYVPGDSGDIALDFMIHTVSARGVITRCNEDGTDSGIPAVGITMRTHWGVAWGYDGYGEVDPATGEFETTMLQGSLLPGGVQPGHVTAGAQSTGYCAPYESEALTAAPGVTIGTDVYGSVDVPDFTYTKCLPVVPLMKTRVVDVEGNPIGHVEVQVYNDTARKWVVSSGYRYTNSDRSDPETYGSACFGVSEGDLRVWFNSRSFDGGTYDGVYYGGTWGKTPAGRWQVNGFTMPATGLDLGDQAIPTLFLRGQTNPPLPNVRLYAILNWSSSYGYSYANTDEAGRYDLAIIPTDKITLPYDPDSTSVRWTLRKTPPNGSDCGGTPCVDDYEGLPQSDTAGYPQGAVSAKTTIDWTPGVPLTGEMKDWDGAPVPLMRMQFYRQESGYNWWSYCREQALERIGYDYDGDTYNGSHLCWIAPHEYRYVYVYMPSYASFNPRSDAPHVPLNRNVAPWLQNYLISASGEVLPWDTREVAHRISIRVITSLGLGVPGSAVDFDSSYQTGMVFNNRGDADMYPYGGEAGSPVDPAVQFNINSWVTVTPPEATGLPAFRISETTSSERTLTYIYPVENPENPIILGVDVIAHTESSLTAQFVADQLVDGILCCGLDGDLSACAETADLSETHTLEVAGLAPGTEYQCQVCGSNAGGLDGCSDVFYGTTLVACDSVPPTQANFAYNISDTRINVTWTTNEACLGTVEYPNPADPTQPFSFLEQELGTTHGVIIDGLSPETLYHLTVSCTDTCGNTRAQSSAVTTLETQTDPDVEPPVCSGTVADVGTTYAIFQVSCNEPAIVNVQCSDTSTFKIYIGQNNSAALTLPVSVTSLTPGATYQCGANGIDAFDNQAAFDLPNVTTLTVTSPLSITDLVTSASDVSATVTWRTEDADGGDRAGSTELSYVEKTDAACPDKSAWPATATTLKNLSPVVAHGVDLAGLQPETTYCFYARSVGLTSSDETGVLTFTTLAIPVALAVDSLGIETLPESACEDMRLTLALSKPAEIILQVSPELRPDGGLLNPMTAYGRPAASAHTILLGGLTPGVTHYYSLLVYDQDGGVVRQPTTGFATFTNCGGLPNAAPTVTDTGGSYVAECGSDAGGEVTLTGTVHDPYACTLAGCPGDEALTCTWIDTVYDAVVASTTSTGAIAGSPDEAQTCTADATLSLGTHFLKLEATEPDINGLSGTSGSFQVTIRDTTSPCISAGPDVAWGALASDCTTAAGAPGVLVDVLDLDGDGNADLAARPTAEDGVCDGAAVSDICDAAPTVTSFPAAFDEANHGPYVHCVAYGDTLTVTYQATDSVGNAGSDSFTVSVADLCDGVDCSHLDGDCLIGVCEPATGVCGTTPRADLTTCDDADACTVSDVCRGGVCLGAPKCDYMNSDATCTIGVCDAGVCHQERDPDPSCNHAPTARCVAVEAILDAAGNVSITAAAVAGTSTDVDSDALTMSIDPDSFSCADLGANTVVASISDYALTSTCDATVTVSDATAPTVECPADVTASTDAGTCVATLSYADPTTADNCGGTAVSLTSGLGSGGSFGLGTHTETWLATDIGGNTAACSFDVVVSDGEAPSVVCPADIAAETDAGVCGAAVSFADATASDNCGDVSVAQTAGPTSGDTVAVGASGATFTATDAAGLTATCELAITVADTELPAVTCPESVSTSTDAGYCGAVVSFADPVTSDNCDAASFALTEGLASGAFFPLGATAETFTATDAAGLSASCGFSVSVSDDEAPTVTCAADVTTGTDAGACVAVVAYADATAYDNCGDATVALASGLGSGASFGLGAHTETWQATDTAGNSASCDLAITVADDEAPVLGCPSDIITNTAPGLCTAAVSFADPTASDNCAVASTTQTAGLASGADFPAGVTAQAFEAADAAGNTTSCGFAVTVTDAEAPTATCPADIAVGTDAGQCGAVVTFAEPTGADNCGVTSTSVTGGLASGALFPVGTTAQTLAVADAAGLTASCGFGVTVSDTEPPSITCPADVVVGDGDGCTALVNYAAPTGADNCGGVTTALASGIGSGNIFPVGDTVETWTATDAAGLTASCSFTVTVLNTDGDGDGVPCLEDSNDTDPTVCRDVDADTCDDCASGTDDVSNDGLDEDADGICDATDGCVADPNKVAPGICGCNYPDLGDADADGVLDCVDVCAGADDTVDDDLNGIPDGCDNIAIIVDNDNANNVAGETESSQTGEWTATGGPDCYLNDSTRSVAGVGTDTATFTAYLPQDGAYEVYAAWVSDAKNATNAPYTVTEYTGLKTIVAVDQTVAPSGAVFDGHELQLLGTFEFRGGVASSVVLSDAADGRVSADAVAFKFVGAITIEPTAPVLTVVRALDANTLEVTFDVAIDPGTDAAGWSITDANGNALGITGCTVDGTTATLTTDTHAYNLDYVLEVVNVYDLAGNMLGRDDWSYLVPMPTVIVDNLGSSASPTATCTSDRVRRADTKGFGFYANDELTAPNRRTPGATCTYTPNVTIAGNYTVSARWTDDPKTTDPLKSNRTARAHYTINDVNGQTLVIAAQNENNGGRWNDLGVATLDAGSGSVVVGKGDDSKYIVYDAIRFKPVVDLGASGDPRTASSADGLVTLDHASDYDMWIAPVAMPEDGAIALATALPALTLVGTVYEVGPSGEYPAGTPALMTMQYDDAALPAGTDEATLSIYTLNGAVWEELVTVSRDTVANIIVAEVPHQSIFALVTRAPLAVDAPVVATDVTVSPEGRFDTFLPPETITISFQLPEPYDVADVSDFVTADGVLDALSVSSADGIASVTFDGAALLDLAGPNIITRTHTLTGYLRARPGDDTPPAFDWVPFQATATFDIVTSLDKSKVHFHGAKPYARFEGSLVLAEGQVAEDFRSALDAGHGSVSVTLGDDLVVYDAADLRFDVTGATSPNRDENWTYTGESLVEEIKFRWDTAPEYDAANDPALPASVGELYSEFIHVSETSLVVDFKKATLPLTVTVDGIVLATIQANGRVDSALHVEVYKKRATVLFPGRLVPGNVIAWYRDADPTDGVDDLVYTHECAADGTATATYVNGTARFDVTVPLPAGIDADALSAKARLSYVVGEPGVTLVTEGLIDVDYGRDNDHGDADWMYVDPNDRHADDQVYEVDDHDHTHCHGLE